MNNEENERDGAFPYPFETLRHWYVAPFGGLSLELRRDQVGIHKEALRSNTELVPHVDRVRISILGENRNRPLLLDADFEVIALDRAWPDAFPKSPCGEVVLPEGEELRPPFVELQPGQALILNSVASKRLLEGDERLIEAILEEARKRKEF